ncbi:MAG: prepilin-type N-terminal cleavage/methylation domain-containing protein [Verrucomicrobiota bacterium]
MNKRRLQGGFSLVEVIIALGVLTVSLIGILAMFPVAFDTARESTYETRVAFIAQSLLSDIKSTSRSNSTAAPDPNDPPVITREAQILGRDLGSLATIDLEAPSSVDFFFSLDLEGQILNTLNQADFDNGSPASGFVARVSSTYNDPTDPSAAYPGLTEIQIVVEAPGAAPVTARKSYPFVTLLSLP